MRPPSVGGLSLLPMLVVLLSLPGDVFGQGAPGSALNPIWPGSSNPCPPLNKEVPEHTPLDSVLFTFETDASRLELSPLDPEAVSGFLDLVSVGENVYQILLVRELDLNDLNPRPPPLPDSDEQIDCNYSNPADQAPQPLIKSIDYTLKCTISLSQTTVQVESLVRVAVGDVNDKAPYFMCAPYYKTVSELTPVDTTVFTLKGLATDRDIYGGIAGYRLEDGGGAFALSGGASEGYIVVDGPLDYDVGPREYALNISTTDIGDPPLTNWTLLYISLADGDDQNPTFDHNLYTLRLPEQTPSIVNTSFNTVPPVSARDMDSGINAPVGFEITQGHVIDGQSYFAIDGHSGQIQPIRELDVDVTSQFVLQLRAFQWDSPTNRFSYATLIVVVQDTNNHSPEFPLTSLAVTLPEHSPRGYRVSQVQAVDRDQGSFGMFAYYIIDPSGVFDLDLETGVLSVADPSELDREVQSTFVIDIYAEETRTVERYRSDNLRVTVTLSDINDNNPTFPTHNYKFLVNNTVQDGDVIGKVEALDPDEAANGDVRYNVLYASEGASALFAIDSETGDILTISAIRRELHILSYVMTVQARDQPLLASDARFGYTQVEISVIILNDNPPRFLNEVQSISISESVPTGTTTFTFEVLDEDDDLLTFTKTHGDSEERFHLDSASGVLTTRRPLDREEASFFVLTISVTDGIHTVTSLLEVTVGDVNDNIPLFTRSEFVFSIHEQLPSFTNIGYVMAVDADIDENAQIQYRILENSVEQYLVLDPVTGMLTTAAILDREGAPVFHFTVEARDMGIPALSTKVKVTVYLQDINDNMPQFLHGRSFTVRLPEGAQPGFLFQVQTVDADVGDNALTRYEMVAGDPELFDLDPGTGELSTLRSVDVDEITSEGREISLVIAAYNVMPYVRVPDVANETLELTVIIQDVNDERPVFSMAEYRFTVSESLAVGALIGRVSARDADYSAANRQVRYWLSADSSQSALGRVVFVDELTGTLRLLRVLEADGPEANTQVQVTVYASDHVPSWGQTTIHNASALINITIEDANDNPPRFEQDIYRITVPENVTLGTTVLTLGVSDLDSGDNGNVTLNILSDGDVFAIEGLGLVVTENLANEESPSEYHVTIVATDHGQPPLIGTTVVVVTIENINDHWPEFAQANFTFSLEENQPIGVLLGLLSATDGDGDTLTYTVQDQYDDLFSVNRFGELRAAAVLDREERTGYSFTVICEEVMDPQGRVIVSPHTAMATVVVLVTDQNDNAPRFTESSYHASFEEGERNVVLLLQLEATDPDFGAYGDVTYSVVSHDEDAIFEVDPSQGHVILRNGSGVDYVTQPSYRLTVMARDGGTPPLSTVTSVIIDVIDTNNHAPRFTMTSYTTSIWENEVTDSPVIQVAAVDEDTIGALTFDLVQRLNGVPFWINSQTGLLSTSQSLDREARETYTLNVSVYDGIHIDYATVYVTVLDRNDNKPRFRKAQYSRSVSLDTPIGLSILDVQATDPDAGINGFVTHWVKGSHGKFHLDPYSGVMTLAGALNDPGRGRYDMVVFAQDHGSPLRTANVTVTLYLSDTNKHAPEFVEFAHHVTIPENVATTPPQPVIKVNVSDLDEGDAGKVTLALGYGNVNETFVLGSTGDISVVKPLDFEKIPYYSVEVVATDLGSDPKSATATVRVTVADVNDNAPRFLPHAPETYIESPASFGQLVTQLVAMDADSALHGNNDVTYDLLSHSDLFSLDSATGALRTAATVPTGSYHLQVGASDSGETPLSTQTSLWIHALGADAMRVRPVFSEPFYTVSHLESQPPPRNLVNVDARLDSSGAGNSAPWDAGVSYAISATSREGVFAIDRTSGALRLISDLDRETFPQHTLVVSATRTDNPAVISHVLVVVTVQDANDEIPEFPFLQYMAAVPEDTPTGSTIIKITANDPDSNAQLLYYLLTFGEVTDGYFFLAQTEGAAVVALEKELDRETLPDIIDLFIGVSDGPNAGSPALVQIKVKDVNDNPPAFAHAQYDAAVPEGLGPCGEVTRLSADDPDTVDEGKLVYRITESDYEDGRFHLDPASGLISVSCDYPSLLDREDRDLYHLDIAVADSDDNQATTRVVISVSDVNDEAPVFLDEPYEFQSHEGPLSLQLQMRISLTDGDIGNNSKVIMTVEDDPQDYFQILQVDTNGIYTEVVVGVVRDLDREDPDLVIQNTSALLTFTLLATDMGTPALSTSTTITIWIEDINDNGPIFEQSGYAVTVPEDVAMDTVVLTARARDSDVVPGTGLQYGLQDPHASGLFAVGVETGDVVLLGELDFAAQSIYSLTLTATDGVFTTEVPLTVTVLDTNNHDPIFTQDVYYFSVSENDQLERSEQFVGSVLAVDADSGPGGHVVYNITSRNARGLFAITEPSEGAITVIGTLNRETVDHYTLTVIAQDQGLTRRMRTCEVEVDVLDLNDNPPQFELQTYSGRVAEHAQSGSTVFMYPEIVAVDSDKGLNAKIRYELSGAGAELFHIDPDQGLVTVGDLDPTLLDREVNAVLYLRVLAFDRNGDPDSMFAAASLTIHLDDVNDHAPEFEHAQYNFSVSEAVSAGAVIGSVWATDQDAPPNDRVLYGILGGEGGGKFFVDRLSGELYVAGGLDREIEGLYVLNISATDTGVTPGPLESFTTVIITVGDFNDNNPVFSLPHYVFYVLEEKSAPVTVGTLSATDDDLGQAGSISYYITDRVPFIISEVTGEIFTTAVLDRENTPEYTFNVLARDHGYPVQSTEVKVKVVVLDTNDITPYFEQTFYSVTILEKSPLGSVVFLPKALDGDLGQNANLTFGLTAQNGADRLFTIDRDTGLIQIAQVIDRMQLLKQGFLDNQNRMTLTLTASDHGIPPLTGQSVLSVHVNDVSSDDAPVFSNFSYHANVSEGSPQGTLVLRVEARTESAFTIISYAVIGSAQFTVSQPETGDIVTTGISLDYETQPEHMLTVRAVDDRTPQRTSYAVVQVSVDDSNDISPRFDQLEYYFTVAEGHYPEHVVIGQVKAVDGDSGDNGRVTYTMTQGDTEAPFFVNAESGHVTVSGYLDREEIAQYELVAQATDFGFPALTSKVITRFTILDINDNRPRFEQDAYSAEVTDLADPGAQVLELSARDVDLGLSGTVVYDVVRLETGQADPVPFYIQNRGDRAVLRVASQLNANLVPYYEVKVIAHDLGSPSLTASATVEVSVASSNEDGPRFSKRVYAIKLSGSVPVNATVLVLRAGEGSLTYTITAGNTEGFLHLDPHTGVMTLSRRLDADSGHVLDMTLRVEDDRTPPFTDTARLLVTVVTSSDVPVFEKAEYRTQLPENTRAPVFLLDLDTVDERLGIPVKYYIVDQSYSDLFHLEERGGELWTKQIVDREKVSAYRLTVGCDRLNTTAGRDKRDLSDVTNKVVVIIEVTDDNDNRPLFPEDPIILGISSDTTYNSLLTTVQAIDLDIGNNSAMHYSIPSGTDLALFYIHPITGELFSRADFSQQKKNRFEFIAMAIDNWGRGHSTTVKVNVALLSDDQIIVVVANMPVGDFRNIQNQLLFNLSDVLGWKVKADHTEPHVAQTDTGLHVNLNKTDLYMYVVDPETGEILTREKVLENLDQNSPAIRDLLTAYKVEQLTSTMAAKATNRPITATEAGLIALGCVIVFGTIVGLICVCIMWKSHRKNTKAEAKRVYAHVNGKRSPGTCNPAFKDTENDLYSQPIEVDNIDVFDSSFKPMETQRLSIYLPAESEPGSSSDSVLTPRTQHHEKGNGVTPGKRPPGQGHSRGQSVGQGQMMNQNQGSTSSPDSWVKPYPPGGITTSESVRDWRDGAVEDADARSCSESAEYASRGEGFSEGTSGSQSSVRDGQDPPVAPSGEQRAVPGEQPTQTDLLPVTNIRQILVREAGIPVDLVSEAEGERERSHSGSGYDPSNESEASLSGSTSDQCSLHSCGSDEFAQETDTQTLRSLWIPGGSDVDTFGDPDFVEYVKSGQPEREMRKGLWVAPASPSRADAAQSYTTILLPNSLDPHPGHSPVGINHRGNPQKPNGQARGYMFTDYPDYQDDEGIPESGVVTSYFLPPSAVDGKSHLNFNQGGGSSLNCGVSLFYAAEVESTSTPGSPENSSPVQPPSFKTFHPPRGKRGSKSNRVQPLLEFHRMPLEVIAEVPSVTSSIDMSRSQLGDLDRRSDTATPDCKRASSASSECDSNDSSRTPKVNDFDDVSAKSSSSDCSKHLSFSEDDDTDDTETESTNYEIGETRF